MSSLFILGNQTFTAIYCKSLHSLCVWKHEDIWNFTMKYISYFRLLNSSYQKSDASG
ncbi:hypothetical protein SAMN05428978_100893 [Nitrosomonas sp. Nm34]|nr:hypothetical protein SAMN05428978_100893 [Nitrosomonas sp. Nm34]